MQGHSLFFLVLSREARQDRRRFRWVFLGLPIGRRDEVENGVRLVERDGKGRLIKALGLG